MNQKSKFLSFILRHRPEAANITLDNEGWTDVNTLLVNAELSLVDLEEIVRTDTKGRYSFNGDASKIRANQGHSTSTVKMSFKTAIPPTILYHGTTEDALSVILKTGIKKMNRHHVHLSATTDVAQTVASRRKNPKLLRIDAKAMLSDGHTFYLSENGVWLVDYVDPKYLSLFKSEK